MIEPSPGVTSFLSQGSPFAGRLPAALKVCVCVGGGMLDSKSEDDWLTIPKQSLRASDWANSLPLNQSYGQESVSSTDWLTQVIRSTPCQLPLPKASGLRMGQQVICRGSGDGYRRKELLDSQAADLCYGLAAFAQTRQTRGSGGA